MKCRRQVDPKIYSSNLSAWRSIYAKEGLRGVIFGWSPTFVGYSFQGAGKYGFYEYFKYLYGDHLFPNMNRTVVFLGASASAEFLADMALCPWEAIKVRMQTTLPPYAQNMRQGWSKIMASDAVHEFTDDNFDTEVLNSDQPVLVDFWAEWCGPCRLLTPTIEKLADDYQGKVKVGKVDTEQNRAIAGRYNINAIPTVLLFKNGEVVETFVGLKNEDEFKAVLDNA